MAEKQWYPSYQKQLKEQADTQEKPVVTEFNLGTAPKQKHVWVDRGLKLSCETASHPYHQVWKKVPMQQQ